MVAVDSIRIRLLGGLVVEGLSDSELGTRKARMLVKVLALARGAPVSVSQLADVLWGDDLPTRSSDQIGVLVSRLRKVLGAERLVRSEAGFALIVDWLDVDELTALVGEAAGALQDGRFAAARAAAGAALLLARGEVLPEDEGEWVEVERASIAVTVTRARGLAATAAFRAGDYIAAELAAESALAHDPFDEVALRTLMQAQAAVGRPASALASYARTRQRLADDLGVSPSVETETLHTALLLGGDDVVPVSVPIHVQLLGRDRDLAALTAHMAAAQAAVRVIVVVGEVGIGKSTLVHHFADRVRETGARTVVAHADELGRDLPLQPILDAACLVGVIEGGDGPNGSAIATPAAGGDRDRLFSAVLGELTSASSFTLLVLDDAHCADGATKEWLTWVQRRPGSMMVIAVTRPGLTLPGAHVLELGPLDGDAISALIDGADPTRAHLVHVRSGGNPLFALALAAAPDGELPASVEQAVASTIARVDPTTADLVRVAAVLDAAPDVDLLGGVLRIAAIDIVGRLERAAEAGLLVESGSGFKFRHALVRETLDAMTGAARRAFLHREAARILQERPNHDPLAVAVHARLGGAMDIASPAFRRAAAVSFGRSDLAAAEVQLRASLHAVETSDAHQMLARVLMVARRLDEAAEEAARAIALGGGSDAFEVAGWVDYYRRRYDRAQRFADEAVSRAAPASPIRTSALALGGRVRHGTGDIRGAEERLVSALDGPPAVRGVAEVWLSQVRVHEGRPHEALDLVEHALLDPEHLAHPFAPIHGRFARIMAFGQLGRIGEALHACGDLREAIDCAGAVGARFPATELNVRAWLLRGVGRLAEADELNRAAIELNGAADGAGPSSVALAEAYWVGWLDLTDGHLARDDIAGASSQLRRLEAMDAWDGTMAWHQRHRLGLLRARVARAGGDDDASAQLATNVMSDATRRGTPRYAALAHVQLALAGGDSDLDQIGRTLATLRRCAALELPGLLDGLGKKFDVDAWRIESEERFAGLSNSSQQS